MRTLPEGCVVKEKGQVVLLILLVMSVVLTVVLSILARSVTDISITKYEDNSIRAFNAAEAGIEKAILGVPCTNCSLDNGATYNSVVNAVAGIDMGSSLFGFAYPIDLNSGESATVWFVSHDDNGDITCSGGKPCMGSSQINVCWGKPGTVKDAYAPAILVEIFYYAKLGFIPPNPPDWDTPTRDYSMIYVARTTSDPYSSRGNGFVVTPPSASSCVIGNYSYAFSQVVKLNPGGMNLPNFQRAGGILMAKIHMLYNVDSSGNSIPQPLGIVATWSSGTFPAQGNLIQSTGSAGDSSRKLSVFQGYSELPYVFNSAIYSASDITK